MIALIDYDAGNTCSVMNALNRLKVDFTLTDDESVIRKADKVIFPGVGHAGAAMEALRRKGLVSIIKSLQQPVLGICVGMQLLAEYSEEGNTDCLNIIPGKVSKFNPVDNLKVPHMGWNNIEFEEGDDFFQGIKRDDFFYFVHSYYMAINEFTISRCHYGHSFACAVKKDNFTGIQFHAEKSGIIGEKLLKNFIK